MKSDADLKGFFCNLGASEAPDLFSKLFSFQDVLPFRNFRPILNNAGHHGNALPVCGG